MVNKDDNQNLVHLLQRGSVTAFDSLFEVYSGRLYNFVLKYLKNAADAEELVQVVFVKIWENRENLQSELSFKSYLFTISLNLIRKHFNKKAIALRYIESLHENYLQQPLDTFSKDEDYESIMEKINLIIEEMPPRRREIFIKSKLEGKSSKQIAEELGISNGTVDNQVSEALHQLRFRLKYENINLMLLCIFFI